MAIIKQDSKIVKDNQLVQIENVVDSQAKADIAEQNAKTYTDQKIAQIPAPPVTSVNGKTGAVSLGKGDVGLGNVDNVKQATKTEFDAHANNTNNPHGVTKAQVGLGSVQNYGIATQAQAEAGTANNVYMTPQRTKQAIDAHANNTNNPHGVTKAQVGLGNVQNYGIATQAEAQAGTSNSKYMTPLRTKEAITALTGGVPLRVNNGMLEYNDGSGWKPVGGIFSTKYKGSAKVEESGSYKTVLSISGTGRLRYLSFNGFTSSDSGGGGGVKLLVDGTELLNTDQFGGSNTSWKHYVYPMGLIRPSSSNSDPIYDANISFKSSLVVQIKSSGRSANVEWVYEM